MHSNDVTAADRSLTDTVGATAPRLLEQLMQIARTSALEEMASGIAHELNQPIGAITTFAQTAERMLDRPSPLLAEAREVLHHIGGEAWKAGKGIHRIRELFGRPTVARVRADLTVVVAELLPILELLARRHGAQVNVHIPAALPLVAIDRLSVQHVIFTLVQNALESPTEAVDPVVSIEVQGDRYSVLTTVIDKGAGIADDVRDQLFRPFFTTKQHGTGLGLASSRAIIEAHEGTIGFESTEPGARFWFRLPITSGEDGNGDGNEG